ncbi:MAG: type II secretion system F family protein [Clostridia bacterium]|nr:type II secretion system F family protein [Clostridia bacterium]
MKKYKYVAININRKKFSGIFLAESEEHLRKQLSDQQLFLLSCKVVSDKSPNPFFSLTGKISIKELTSFCRQLSIMLNSSIEIVNCLEVLKNQPYTQYFKKILSMLYEDVKAGKLMSEAMEKHKKIFPDFFRNMVYVGEMSSSLEKILNNVADYYETEQKTRGKVKSAMVYPITLMIMMVGILAIMLVFVVPTFRNSLSQLNIEMPPLTQAIFVASDFFIENWKMIFLIMVGIWLVFKMYKKTKRGRYFTDMLKIKMPLFKKYQIASVTSKFSRGFGLLLASGMNMVECMEVIKKVLGNKFVEKKFEKAIEDVKKGVKLTTALEKMEIFPVMLIQMVSIGEKTASLEDVLIRSCDYFDEQLQITLNSLTSLLQPALMLVMGVLIGIIFVAVYSPLISIMENLA